MRIFKRMDGIWRRKKNVNPSPIASWNIGHLNNPFTRKKVRQILENQGYVCPEICSPDELLEGNK